MNEIGKFSAKILFYAVAAVLLLWTASLTVAFVDAALPGMPWYIPYLSLVIFDAGMIAWLYVFLRHAQGTIQRGVALLATAVNFIGVGLMVMAEILLGGQTMVVAPEGLGSAAIWGIGIWTVINVAAVLLFHVGDPEAQKQMSIQNEKDAIWRGALAQLANLRQQHSAALTQELSERMYAEMLDELLIDADGNGRPDILEGKALPPSQAKEMDGRQIAQEFNGIPARPTQRPSPNGNGNPQRPPHRQALLTHRVTRPRFEPHQTVETMAGTEAEEVRPGPGTYQPE